MDWIFVDLHFFEIVDLFSIENDENGKDSKLVFMAD